MTLNYPVFLHTLAIVSQPSLTDNPYSLDLLIPEPGVCSGKYCQTMSEIKQGPDNLRAY